MGYDFRTKFFQKKNDKHNNVLTVTKVYVDLTLLTFTQFLLHDFLR